MGDWTDPIYILSQIFVILSFIGFGITYLIKSRPLLLAVVIISNTLIGVGYVMLSAWVGVGMCVISIVRDFVSYVINSKRSEQHKNKITKLDWYLLALWSVSLFAITMVTQNGFLTWFAFLGTITYTVAIWQKNILVYKYLGFASCVSWTIYNLVEKNFFGTILEAFLLATVIVGIVTYYTKPQKETNVEQQHPLIN